jgi:hypothetical protein
MTYHTATHLPQPNAGRPSSRFKSLLTPLFDRAGAAALSVVLSLSAMNVSCTGKGGDDMPLLKQGRGEIAQQKSVDAIITGITSTIKGWKTEKDVTRDFIQVSAQLDRLCRQGTGKDLLRLYGQVSNRLIDLEDEMSMKKQNLHGTIWNKVEASRSDASTFAGLFLGLPRINNMPIQTISPSLAYDGEYHFLTNEANGILQATGKGGAKFRIMEANTRKDWMKDLFGSADMKEGEKVSFFESIRKAYLLPSEPAKTIKAVPTTMPASAPVTAEKGDKEKRMGIVPLKK